MHRLLQGHGIIPASQARGPMWQTELGHHLYVSHTPHAGWNLNAVHLGDPQGAGVDIPLGTHDEEEAARRVAAELRHPETVGHLRDQYLRAALNNDPTGLDQAARRVPTAAGDWTRLNHYGD
jgi:hypothetical protein